MNEFIQLFRKLGLSFRVKNSENNIIFTKDNLLAFILVKTESKSWELIAQNYIFTKQELNLIWKFIEKLEANKL